MKFIHFADLHFGNWTKGAQLDRRREITKTFSRMIDFANENDVDFILSAGDMLEMNSVNMADLRTFRDIIKKSNCPIYAVTGNHDPLSHGNAYEKIDWPENFHLAQKGWGRFNLPEFGVIIHTYGWSEREISSPPPFEIHADKSYINILLLHADAINKSEYFPVDVRFLRSLDMDYIALGHIHKPQEISKNIIYAGSPEPIYSNETGEHGFYLCEMVHGEIQAGFVPFAQRKYVDFEVELHQEDSSVTIAEKVAEVVNQTDIFKIHLTGSHEPIDVTEIENDFLEKGISVKLLDKTTPSFNIDILMNENRGNILGRFIASFGDIESLSHEEKQALFIGIDALLKTRKG